MQPFAVRRLDPAQIDRAFPLAQAIGLHDLAAWRDFVTEFTREADDRGALVDRDTGIVVAEDPRGTACGMFCYRVDRYPVDGAHLVCDPFVVADLPRYTRPLQALLDEAERIAARTGCDWIRIVLPANGDPLSVNERGCEAALFRANFALENLSFRKHRAMVAVGDGRDTPLPKPMSR